MKGGSEDGAKGRKVGGREEEKGGKSGREYEREREV